MKIGRFSINLANKAPERVGTEIGTLGTQTPSLFGGEVISFEKITTSDYIKMRQTDGTVSALYNVLTLPIIANPWDIEPEDDTPEAQAQAEFVKDALSRPPHKGGMTTPIDLVLSDMLRAVLEGWRAYEKVFELRASDQRIVYRKIAPRDQATVTILQDDRGGFNEFKQRAYIGKEYKEVTIDRPYAFLFTFGKEKHHLRGESAFRAAYYHFEKKHRLYYVAHQAIQFGAIKPKIVKAPKGAKQDQIDAHVAIADMLGFNSSIGLPDGWELEPYDAGNGRLDPVPLIDHHNAEMARSILAQFIMLGTGGAATTGSWALSQDQTDMFVIALRGLMSNIENHITSYLIPDLVEYNFATPKYPRFTFANITDSTTAMLKDVALKILEKRPEGISTDMIDGVVKKLANQLDIELPEDDKADTDDDIDRGESAENPQQQSAKRGNTHFLADKRWKRPLTTVEKKVNFTGIEKQYTDLESEFINAAKPLFDAIRADTVKRIEKILDSKKYAQLESFEIKVGPAYRKLILDKMIAAYGFAKNGAADELGVGTPATPTKSRETIKQQATAIVDKQLSDIAFEVKTIITEALRKNQLSTSLSVGDVLATIGAAITSYYTDKVPSTAGVIFATAITMGRDDVFVTYRNRIQSYQYSAILDDATCAICEDLDGNVVDEAEYRSTPWLPPIHFNCRCLWVAIMTDEEEPPEITGLPFMPGGTEEPALSRKPHETQVDAKEVADLHAQIATLTEALAAKVVDEEFEHDEV